MTQFAPFSDAPLARSTDPWTSHAAAIQAGIRKKRTVLDDLRTAWAKASDTDRAMFLSWISS